MPDWKQYVRSNLPPLELGRERELEIIEELAQHLEAVFDQAIADGASQQQAFELAAAHIKDWRLFECELIRAKRPVAHRWVNRLPNFAEITQAHQKKGVTRMGSTLQDVRFGIRMLRKSPGFTAVAVVSLALGIGANTAIFSLVDAVLLKTLPVRNANELVLFDWLSGRKLMARSINGVMDRDKNTGLTTSSSFSYDTFKQFQNQNRTLIDLFAFAELEQLNVNVDGQAEIATGQVVSGRYYESLGVPAIAGRAITESDDQPDADPVAVISYRYWQRRFAGDTAVVGKAVSVNGVVFSIIGVAPRGFEGTLQVGSSPDLSIPIAMEPRFSPGGSMLADSGTWWLQIMGRLRPGATFEQTRASLETAFQESAIEGYRLSANKRGKKPPEARSARDEHEQPDTPMLRVASGSRGLNDARAEYSVSLFILVSVVGLVLLIACANVATLLLSRAAARRKEIAVRLALGASRSRLISQLLTESVLLALFGGAVGVIFAYWGKDLLLTLRPFGGGAIQLDLRLDIRVLGFTVAISLLTGILFGLAPALRATRVALAQTLKESDRGLVGAGRLRLSRALVVLQIAISLVLLIGSGLFLRTLRNLHSVDVGFNTRNVLLFRVDPRLSGYKKTQIVDLYQRMLERIEALPGVSRATISRHPLLSGGAAIDQAFVEGKAQPTSPESTSMSDLTWVQRVRSNFFETMEIPIVLGRPLVAQDDERAVRVGVINQTMALKHFGDENPIGKRFGFGDPAHSADIEIVGVAADAKYSSIRRETPSTVYLPYLQDAAGVGQMNFEIRTAGDPVALVASIRDAVRSVDANVPLFDVKTQEQQADQSLAAERLFATLSTFFGALALMLACIGLDGVMSYSIERRTNEIGIRMALGARAVDVARMVLRETLVMVVVGVVIGLGSALAVTRLIESMLFGLTPTDPWTILSSVLAMIVVAICAGYLPARRAARVDPLSALKYE